MRRLLLVLPFLLAVLPAGPAAPSPIPPHPELWVMASDGSEERPVTTGYWADGSWSPDGARLAYFEGGAIWIYELSTGEKTSLLEGAAFSGDLAWSPSGDVIAFTGGSGIDLVDVDTGERRDLTDSTDFNLAWSPDGSTLAFVRNTQDAPHAGELWLLDIATGAERQLAADASYSPAPEWSPDGSQTLFHRYAGGISVIDLTTGATRPISNGYTTAKWTHDGSRIAFNRASDVYIVAPDGTQETKITTGTLSDAHPLHDALLVSRESDLFVVALDGTSTRLTDTRTYSEYRGDWSPDGQSIAFLREEVQVLCGGPGPYAVQATIFGTPSDDVLEGTPGFDVIAGLGGNDSINGRGGDDIICGDDGHDVLLGGSGADYVTGGTGRDVLRGGRGPDHLLGERGDDTLGGGRGHDRLYGGLVNSAVGQDVGDGGGGFDLCKHLQRRRNCER